MTALDVLRWTEIYIVGAAEVLVLVLASRTLRRALRGWPEQRGWRSPTVMARAFALLVLAAATGGLSDLWGPDLSPQWWEQTLHGPFEVVGVVSIFIVELLKPVMVAIAALSALLATGSLFAHLESSGALDRFRSHFSRPSRGDRAGGRRAASGFGA